VSSSSTKSTGRRKAVTTLVLGRAGARLDRAADLARAMEGGGVEIRSEPLEASDDSHFSFVGVALVVPDTSEDVERTITALQSIDPAAPTVVVGDDLDALQVARAFRCGAAEVIFLDDSAEARSRLAALVERRASARGQGLLPAKPGVPRILGNSPGMKELTRLLVRVAPAEATVLVLGESGTGKELVAKALHVLSPRKKGPFVAINCAAIPDTLLENELFGHEKGSFTGANATAIGKVEAAEKGTLFLDEIGEMPLPLQAKILRLLQEKTYDRIGATRTRQADIRIVAATNRDLKEQVAEKRFREDLYYRLSVVPLLLPALRDRPEDIPVIAQSILEKQARALGRPALRFTEAAMQRLETYRWPGNVRELENEIERAAVLAQGDAIDVSDLDLRARVADPARAALSRLAPLDGPLATTLEAVQRSAARIRIAAAIDDAGGDREAAASELGITLDELNEKLTD
jgi:DNA-binding NtrC family response regulator